VVPSAPDFWTRIILHVQIALLVLLRPTCQLGLRILGGLESGEGFIVESFFQVRHVLPNTPNQIEGFLFVVVAPCSVVLKPAFAWGRQVSLGPPPGIPRLKCPCCWRRFATRRGEAKFHFFWLLNGCSFLD
jgi:hypothetical protein